MSENLLSHIENNHTSIGLLNSGQNRLTKREVHNGKILEKPSSSRKHNLIGSNATIAVGSRVRGQCEIYVNDMRVKLAANSFCYPDVVIVQGEPKFEDGETDLLLNPTIVIEVLSKATICHDKTEKLDCYLAMESIRECLLINEDLMRVEHYSKQTINQWIYRIFQRREDKIPLDSIKCEISVGELYSRIKN
jgi:Uma2 family endonuclease